MLQRALIAPSDVRDALPRAQRLEFDLEYLTALNKAATSYNLEGVQSVVAKWTKLTGLANAA